MDADTAILDEIEIDITRTPNDLTIQLRIRPAQSDTEIVVGPEPLVLPADLDTLIDQPQEYGRKLGGAVFAAQSIQKKMAQIAGLARTNPMRLRLLTNDPALHKLRWETVAFDGKPLFDSLICVSRFLPPAEQAESPLFRPSLKALIFVSNPAGIEGKADVDQSNPALPPSQRPKFAHIDPAIEKDLAERNLKGGADRNPDFSIETEFLASPGQGTLSALLAKLDEGFDILYMVCHGSVGLGYPCLYLEGDDQPVNAQETFVPAVSRVHRLPRLIVLASCQSAGSGNPDTDTIASKSLTELGPLLAGIGVPAVIAMQGFVTMTTARIFMSQFFAELRIDGQVDRAVAEARRLVVREQRPDYWMPVLFSSSRSGSLFSPYQRGFVAAQQDDKDENTPWRDILRSVQPPSECVPVLGPDCLEPIWGSRREIAGWLAQQYEFPLEEHLSQDLPAVAQWLRLGKATNPVETGYLDYLRSYWQNAIPSGPAANAFLSILSQNENWTGIVSARGDKAREASVELSKPVWKRLRELGEARRAASAQPGGPEDLHGLLAKLPFPLYVTASPDRLLEDALTAEGKKWKSGYPRWKIELYPDPGDPNDQQDPDWEPGEKTPFVYHLLGDESEPASLVVTEQDYDDYMLSINSSATARFTPPFINKMLKNSALLFLGFSLKERAFQIAVRNTLRFVHEPGSAWVGAQLPPDSDHYRRVEAARAYIEQMAKLRIYWGSTQDFVEALGERVRKDPTLAKYFAAPRAGNAAGAS